MSRDSFIQGSAGDVSANILDDDGTGNYTMTYAIAGLIDAVLQVADAIDRLTGLIDDESEDKP